MLVSKAKYEELRANNRDLSNERWLYKRRADELQVDIRCERSHNLYLRRMVNILKEQVRELEKKLAAKEEKEVKINNKQTKDFIEAKHSSIDEMNENVKKLMKQGWSDKLKVKIQGTTIYTVHERIVKGGK